MLKKIITPAIAMVALASPAFAQDGTTASSMTGATGSSFSGPRAEVFGGYINTQSRFRGGATAPVVGKVNRDNATAGVELGYDIPIGDRFVAGPLGSFALTTTNGSSCVGLPNACVRPEMDWSAGGRFGAKVGENALIYAKGAYVQTRIDSRQMIGGTMVSGHDWRGGWRAGAGVEYAIAPHAYVKAEYNFTRTNTDGLGQQGLPGSTLRLQRQAAIAGFGVRF